MKKQFTLSVSSPCLEQWDTFSPTKNGAFCPVCQKEVIDFSKMNEKEINQYGHDQLMGICGRFKKNQLDNFKPLVSHRILPGWNAIRAGILGLSLLFAGQHLMAKNFSITETQRMDKELPATSLQVNQSEKTLSGIVRDENNEPLAGVNIYKENSYTGTVTDLDGKFQLTENFKPGDFIIFSFLGYEPVTYTVEESIPDFLKIALTDYHMMMGEVQMDSPYEQNNSKVNQFWQKVKGIF